MHSLIGRWSADCHSLFRCPWLKLRLLCLRLAESTFGLIGLVVRGGVRSCTYSANLTLLYNLLNCSCSSWMTAWWNWIGWCCVVPGVQQGSTNFLLGAIEISYPNNTLVRQGWFSWLLTAIGMFIAMAPNIISQRVLRLYFRFATFIFFSLFLLYWFWFPIQASRNGHFQTGAGVFNHFYNGINLGEKKEASDAYTWVIGVLFGAWVFYGRITRLSARHLLIWYARLRRLCPSSRRDSRRLNRCCKGNVDVNPLRLAPLNPHPHHRPLLHAGLQRHYFSNLQQQLGRVSRPARWSKRSCRHSQHPLGRLDVCDSQLFHECPACHIRDLERWCTTLFEVFPEIEQEQDSSQCRILGVRAEYCDHFCGNWKHGGVHGHHRYRDDCDEVSLKQKITMKTFWRDWLTWLPFLSAASPT